MSLSSNDQIDIHKNCIDTVYLLPDFSQACDQFHDPRGSNGETFVYLQGTDMLVHKL